MTERIKIVTHTSPAIVVTEVNKLLENGFEILSEYVIPITPLDSVAGSPASQKMVPCFTVFLIERMTR